MRSPCEKIQKALSAYLDNELGATGRSEVEEHLGRCPRCAREKEALARSWALLEPAAAVPPVPAGFDTAVLRKIRAREEARRRVPAIFRLLARPAWAAAALLAAGLLSGWSIGDRLCHRAADAQAVSLGDDAFPLDGFNDLPGDSVAGSYAGLLAGKGTES